MKNDKNPLPCIFTVFYVFYAQLWISTIKKKSEFVHSPPKKQMKASIFNNLFSKEGRTELLLAKKQIPFLGKHLISLYLKCLKFAT